MAKTKRITNNSDTRDQLHIAGTFHHVPYGESVEIAVELADRLLMTGQWTEAAAESKKESK